MLNLAPVTARLVEFRKKSPQMSRLPRKSNSRAFGVAAGTLRIGTLLASVWSTGASLVSAPVILATASSRAED